MPEPRTDSVFTRALASEILASERYRAGVLAAALAALLAADLLLLGFAQDVVQQVAHRPIPLWLPLAVVAPFLFYECVVIFVLGRLRARGRQMPTIARFGNAVVETTLPTAILWVVSTYVGPQVAFGTWPSLLYFLFILAATLRLDFVLPVFTAVVSAIEYMALAALELPLSATALESEFVPLYHLSKTAVFVATGVIAGLVAVRLRQKFVHAMEEATMRERVTNLFGQHVSPAVVDRLLDQRFDAAGELREVCVMFLDIRNFTAQARDRPPQEVVDFLNGIFEFMIEAVDRHQGIVNKFLGDGFMAVFGAPLADADAAPHAVAAAREILAEIDRRQVDESWRLRVGIGINGGLAVTGNVGSPRRKEFTVIGDTVNLASRLEQLTKEVDARLLVSDSVALALGPELPSRAMPIDGVSVKGYDAPLRIWRLDP